MKKFSYEVRDKATDKIEKGEVQADNSRLAGKLLLERGYIPLKIKEADSGGTFSKFTNRITIKDKIVFTRQFSTLVGAGLPLAQGLRTVSEQTENKKMKSVIELISKLDQAFLIHSLNIQRSLIRSILRLLRLGNYPELLTSLFVELQPSRKKMPL